MSDGLTLQDWKGDVGLPKKNGLAFSRMKDPWFPFERRSAVDEIVLDLAMELSKLPFEEQEIVVNNLPETVNDSVLFRSKVAKLLELMRLHAEG